MKRPAGLGMALVAVLGGFAVAPALPAGRAAGRTAQSAASAAVVMASADEDDAVAAAGADAAAAPSDLVHRGGIGGRTTAIATVGRRIYFGAGDRVAMADVDAGADGSGTPPRELPIRFGAEVTAMAGATGADGGERLWVGTGAGWLYVLRLAADGSVASASAARAATNPGHDHIPPSILSVVPLATPGSVAVGGQLGLSLYADTGADIALLGLVEGFVYVIDMARLGTTLYASDVGSLGIIDVTNPARPVLVARHFARAGYEPGVPSPYFVHAVAADPVHRSLLVVGTTGIPNEQRNAWLVQLDAADPVALREVAVLRDLPLTQVSDLVVSDDGRSAWLTAFVSGAAFSDPFGGARAFALALGDDGRWRGADAASGLGQGGGVGASFGASALLADGTLVASVNQGGFERLRRSAGGGIVRAPGIALPRGVMAAEPDAERLWLVSADVPARLSAVDLSRGTPDWLGTWPFELDATSITERLPWGETSLGADGDRVVVAAPELGLYVFDTSVPTQPVLRARKSDIQPFAALVHDGMAFVGLAEFSGSEPRLDAPPQTGLQVYDLRQPDRPRVVAWLTDIGDVCGMRRDGDVLWLRRVERAQGCDRPGQLMALDVRDPAAVRPIGVPLATLSAWFDVDDGRLVVDMGARLDVFDVRDPASPRPLPGVVGAGGVAGLRGSLLFTGNVGTAEVWDLGSIDAQAAPRRQALVVLPSRNMPPYFRQDVVTRGGRMLVETNEQGIWQIDAVPRAAGRAWLPTLAR